MKSPFTGGNVTKMIKKETLTFRNEKYEVERIYFQCNDTGKTFSNSEVDDKVMNDVYEQYRLRHNIPSPSALKSLREKYGFSAHIMSKIAGIGIKQYGLYENGEMPTVVVGHRLSDLFNHDLMLDSINKASNKLGKSYYKVIERAKSFSECRSFRIDNFIYSQYEEAMPLQYPSIAYLARKPRWTTFNDRRNTQ